MIVLKIKVSESAIPILWMQLNKTNKLCWDSGNQTLIWLPFLIGIDMTTFPCTDEQTVDANWIPRPLQKKIT